MYTVILEILLVKWYWGYIGGIRNPLRENWNVPANFCRRPDIEIASKELKNLLVVNYVRFLIRSASSFNFNISNRTIASKPILENF